MAICESIIFVCTGNLIPWEPVGLVYLMHYPSWHNG